jgi:hypothetical protein
MMFIKDYALGIHCTSRTLPMDSEEIVLVLRDIVTVPNDRSLWEHTVTGTTLLVHMDQDQYGYLASHYTTRYIQTCLSGMLSTEFVVWWMSQRQPTNNPQRNP